MKFVPKGIIPPIITPLTDEGEVNYPVLRQMVNHLIENGVHGLFPLGTTGEFYAFDNDTYRKILETVKDETAGRVPVYGGANHITTRGVIELIKILLNFVLNGTTTAGVGELGNFIMGCALVMPAGFIYKQAKTKKHAIIGMVTGIVCMAVASALVNGLLLLPAYGKAFGMPVDTFVEMGAAIIPAIHSLTTFCLFSVAPFNIIKGIVVSLITLLLYKHISRLLKGSQA